MHKSLYYMYNLHGLTLKEFIEYYRANVSVHHYSIKSEYQ